MTILNILITAALLKILMSMFFTTVVKVAIIIFSPTTVYLALAILVIVTLAQFAPAKH